MIEKSCILNILKHDNLMNFEHRENISLYIHIPFCLQRCYYCDFATYSLDETHVTLDQYFDYLEIEIKKTIPLIEFKPILKTIYLGGGTPSLATPLRIEKIFNLLIQEGFSLSQSPEITIEINPATIDEKNLLDLLSIGVNRFSVGAQTFNNELLKKLNRKHSAQDTKNTLNLLKKYDLNYSLDLLYALPHQNLSILEEDLKTIAEYHPPHISPYYLTLKSDHFLNHGRPHENEQIKMIQLVHNNLIELGYEQYEISNYALNETVQSQHNLAYWSDQSYLGLGLSSHSYIKTIGRFGSRFANPPTLKNYLEWVRHWKPQLNLADQRYFVETLKLHESLTDYCHTSLRKMSGLQESNIEKKFGPKVKNIVIERLKKCAELGWVTFNPKEKWILTLQGQQISNQVFLQLTFLPHELTS